MKLAKIAQEETFAEEIHQLVNSEQIAPKSTLLPLNPFIDRHGFLRAGGRLRHSDFSYNKKHPIILPKNHALTKLLFKQTHLKLLHGRPNIILSYIRQKFGSISGRNLAKWTVRSCVKCFRYNPKTFNPIMGDLPAERVTPMHPFFNTGVDYAVPLFIRDKTGRGSKLSKCYLPLCLFSHKGNAFRTHIELLHRRIPSSLSKIRSTRRQTSKGFQ